MNAGLTAGLVWAIGAVAILLVCWAGFKTIQARREAQQRIWAARVRSGHVPLEIPTVRGSLGDAPDTYPEWAKQGRHDQIVVDEQPQIHIRYIDMFGKVNERTIQVDHLDLQRRTIVARGDSIDEPRLFPLEKIQVAKNLETGKTFNLGTWADAVRAARRRRATNEDQFDDAQFV